LIMPQFSYPAYALLYDTCAGFLHEVSIPDFRRVSLTLEWMTPRSSPKMPLPASGNRHRRLLMTACMHDGIIVLVTIQIPGHIMEAMPNVVHAGRCTPHVRE
jgi:hypothetical protein